MKGNWKGIVTKMAYGLAGLGAVSVIGYAWAAEVSPGLSGSALKKGDITRVEPPCWWTGMTNDTLQLMITGPGIGEADDGFPPDAPNPVLRTEVFDGCGDGLQNNLSAGLRIHVILRAHPCR